MVLRMRNRRLLLRSGQHGECGPWTWCDPCTAGSSGWRGSDMGADDVEC